MSEDEKHPTFEARDKHLTFEEKGGEKFGLRPNQMNVEERGLRPNQSPPAKKPAPKPSSGSSSDSDKG
jgi:hypothetical protein